MRRFIPILFFVMSIGVSGFLFAQGQDLAQGCASILIKKAVTNPNGTDTLVDFSAAELNNGIQLQCGVDNYIAADIFLPGGGTDQYVVESIPYNPPIAYNTGNSYAAQLCNSDDNWGTVFSLNYGYPPNPNIPNFTFDFYGVTYPMAIIGANGLISFDYTNQNINGGCDYCQYTQEDSGPIPNTNRYRNCIMAPYYDITFTGGGEIYFQIIGEYPCRKMVLSYYQVPMFRCTSLLATHMCVLYETSNVIEFYIQNKPICTEWEEGLATLGIQNEAGNQGVTIPGYNNSVWGATNEAWRIKPVGELEYTMNWYKRSATDFSQPLQEISPDANGRILASPTVESGPMRYFVKAEVYRNDGYSFWVEDSSAIYYPIDMPDMVITHNESIEDIDTVCRGGLINFELSGAGDNGRYYQIAPYANPADTTVNIGSTFARANNPTEDEVVYTFKFENYDEFGVLICTRYKSCTIVNRSFEVKLMDDVTICKGDEITLSDILNEHPGECTWSTGGDGETLTTSPQASGDIILTKTDNLGCTASDTIFVTVNDSPEVNITGTLAICAGTSTTLTANCNPSNCVFEWSNGSTDRSITVTPADDEEFTVSVKLPPAMCETIKSVTVDVEQAPTVQCSNDALICEGETATIAVAGDATRWVWETADNSVNGGNGTSYTVSPRGTTNYIVHGYNDINCHSRDEVKVVVQAKPTPVIRLNPSVLDALDPTTIITDASTGNVTREWRLSDGYTTTDESFVYTFALEDTSMVFDVYLTAISDAGCIDSTSTFIRVKRDHYLWAPTGIYLHDNNPVNREFRLWIDNLVSYHLEIFNRNGECVFATDDIEKAWDCTYKGETVQQGVYVWKVVYRHNDAPNKEESSSGSFMIYN
jgi:hypothetical protein